LILFEVSSHQDPFEAELVSLFVHAIHKNDGDPMTIAGAVLRMNQSSFSLSLLILDSRDREADSEERVISW
jgi:hypothetical protein